MFGGHSASRKLGGPEMYKVASKAFTAGDPGNSTANIRLVNVEVGGLVAILYALRLSTIGHSYNVQT